ncbi:MAG: class I tRNA ligase family protein, partial [Acidobacteriota bacterium]
FDILFFWVARMMMMGLHFMEETPFHDVYVHALVRDAQGQKMSKSKGNVIDPLIMMDQYGTDALRFTLTAFAVQGRDVKLAEERIEGYKHFVNKIWNASRLVLMNLEGMDEKAEIPEGSLHLMHRWILSRLQRVVAEIDEAMDNYHFNQYAHSVYQFLWHEYCDWYLEMIKPSLYGEDANKKATAQILAAKVLEEVLVLLHPIMPFVTEEIYQKLPQTSGTIMKASFPKRLEKHLDDEAEEQMSLLMDIINGIRNIRGEMNVPPATKVEVVCLCEKDSDLALLKEHGATVTDLARLSNLQAAKIGEANKPKLAASALARGVEVYVVLKDILDFESEAKRLQKEISKLEKESSLTQKKLSNEDYLQKAPPDVIEKEREKGARLSEKMEKLRRHLGVINDLKNSASTGD